MCLKCQGISLAQLLKAPILGLMPNKSGHIIEPPYVSVGLRSIIVSKSQLSHELGVHQISCTNSKLKLVLLIACKITQMVRFFSAVFMPSDAKSLNLNILSDGILRFVLSVFKLL